MTDGLYRHRTIKTEEEKAVILAETKENFPLIFSIGYGSNVDDEELTDWASKGENAYLLESVEELEVVSPEILDSLYHRVR